ncbi:MAG: T9SS type A sorting domain-containing protein [Saprospiraceae bacterium]|nr:T9SS type A sorting domain-containing protein [Candidatus Vicinibacter affinis]
MRIIRQRNFSSKANNRESIDLDINPGIYILTIRSDSGIYTQKIVKLSNN